MIKVDGVEEVPMCVQEYVKTLRPIIDFTSLKEGQKMFNKQSLAVSYIDTFVSYKPDRDIVEYKNDKGEIWCGKGEDYWFFIDEN